ncbi:hypothetical protein Tco_0599158 [Tanacetum coccineum]
MNRPLLRNCKAKNSPNGSKFDNRAKCLIAVDALAWKGDLRIGEEVVKWKFYLRLAIIIPTLERVTIGCCEVDGGGGGDEVFGGGVFGGSVVISGDGVGNGVRGVVCGVTCGVVCDVLWSHGDEGKDSFLMCHDGEMMIFCWCSAQRHRISMHDCNGPSKIDGVVRGAVCAVANGVKGEQRNPKRARWVVRGSLEDIQRSNTTKIEYLYTSRNKIQEKTKNQAEKCQCAPHLPNYLVTLENLYPMDDEPMWDADRVVAWTPGSTITIPETANEFSIKGNIIKIFYHGLSEITQEVLNTVAGGIFLYKTPNQACQLLEDKVLLKLDWAKNQKTKSSLKKIVAFVDEGSSNSDTDKIMARIDAMTIKIDA